MQTVINYLKSLDSETLHIVVSQIGVHPDTTGGCKEPKPADHPTPNGNWICSGVNWLWVPAIG